MLLYGKPVIEKLREHTRAFITSLKRDDLYIAHLLLNDDEPTRVYARLKAKYAQSVGIHSETHELRNAKPEDIFSLIRTCNVDEKCVGIIMQLPLAEKFAYHESEFLTTIAPEKDIDGLSGVVFGNALIGKWRFIPATPRAVFEVLEFYGYTDLHGKTVAVISQSNLIGKPVALELMNRWATLLSCNEWTWTENLGKICAMSDVIVSATGVAHLIHANLLKDKAQRAEKVLIDVGRGIKDGKAVGDSNREELAELWAHITPVPWGVGPVTIACVFDNIRVLQESQQ